MFLVILELEKKREQEEKDSKYVQNMIKRQTESQTKSRNINYPGTIIKRLSVTEDKASWSVR